MSSMVAVIKSVIGQVFAISADGVKRQVFEGDRLFQGEQLLTSDLGAVTLKMPDGQSIDLGNNQQWPLPTDEAEQQDADTSTEDLQQAIAAGLDLTEILPDTAAGPAETGGFGNGGGHSFVVLETTNQQIQFEAADTSSNPPSPALTRDFGQERNETRLTPQQLDPDAPSATITADTSTLQVGETAQVRFSFSEAVQGFSISVITSSGGTISTLTQVDAATWTATFTRGNSGAPGISLAAGSYTDQAGNPGLAASLTINGAPQASDASVSTDENSSLVSQVPAANDPDGNIARYTLISGPNAGSLTFNPDGSYSFNPGSDFDDLTVGTTRQVTFSYNAADNNGPFSNPATVTITVIGSNDAPLSTDLNLTTDEDVPVNGAISANDPDGDLLSYSVTGSPANGTVVLNPATGTFTYTPNAGYGGSDSFVVSMSDGKGGVAASTVTIGINSLNDAPISNDLILTTTEDDAVNGAISASDPDGDALSYSITGNPANGTVVLNPATGTFTYTPNANYNGSDSFVVTISDGNGGTTASTVAITITPENDAPVVGNQSLSTDENVAITGSVGGSDPDGDSIQYSLLSAPNNGVLTLNIVTGNFTYTPNSGYEGSDSFTVTLSDGKGGTATSTIIIGVNPANGAPVANDDSASVIEGNSVSIAVRTNDTDPENDSLSVSGITQGANGSVVIDAVTGNPIYTPNSGFTGTDSFAYTVNDGNGNSDTATVTVTVNPANQPTVMNPESVTVDEDFFILGNVLSNDSDKDDVLRIANYEVNGSTYLTGTNAIIPGVGDITIFSTGDYRFTPEPNYNGPVPVITYTTNTGSSSTLSVTVSPVNDAPIAADDSFTTDEDKPLSIPVVSLLGNDSDIDSDTVQFDSLVSAIGGTVALVGSNVVFTPNANFNGAASFTYTISDGKGKFDSATVTVTVNPLNDPSVMTPEVINLPEDNFALGNVLSNDSDVDDNLRIASYEVNGNTYLAGTNAIITGVGDITIFSTGDYRFTPEPNYNGPVPVITYTTNTGSSSTLTITVDPTNDRPDAVDDSFTTTTGNAINIPIADLLLNDTDIDQDTLSINLVNNAINGTVTISGGLLTFTPTAGFTGTASFNYRVTDGTLTDTATVSITVTPPNAARQAFSSQFTTEQDTAVNVASQLTLNEDDDILLGSPGVDHLNGGTGNDSIFGSAGNDGLNGGIGNDTLIGGTGNNYLSGGEGADLFKWQAGDTGQDVILDFNSSTGDRIDLRDLLVNEQNSDISHYLRLDTATSTLQISSTGQFASGGAADVTIKLEDGSGGNALPDYSGMNQSQIINSLIGGVDPMIKVD